MTTRLEGPLRREVDVNGVAFTITLSPEGVKIVEKGKRKGTELTWEQLIRGDVTLTQDLKDSIDISNAE